MQMKTLRIKDKDNHTKSDIEARLQYQKVGKSRRKKKEK